MSLQVTTAAVLTVLHVMAVYLDAYCGTQEQLLQITRVGVLRGLLRGLLTGLLRGLSRGSRAIRRN